MDAFSGKRIPAVVLEGGMIFSTNTLFKHGIKRLAISFAFVVVSLDLRKCESFRVLNEAENEGVKVLEV